MLKKKGILIFVVLLISVAAIFFANEMQKKLVSNEVASKTGSTVLQGDLKENANEDSKKDANANTQNTDKASNNEAKNEETKDASKTTQQNSSDKVNETSKQSTSKTVAPKSSNTNTAASTNSSTSTNASQTSNGGTNSNQSPNFIVMDEVNNKVICSTRVNFQGRNVADITKDTLTKFNINYSYVSGYFRSINGIRERSLNPSTDGWCYYIKDKKPSIGSSDFTPEDNATITWKYVKDGTKP